MRISKILTCILVLYTLQTAYGRRLLLSGPLTAGPEADSRTGPVNIFLGYEFQWFMDKNQTSAFSVELIFSQKEFKFNDKWVRREYDFYGDIYYGNLPVYGKPPDITSELYDFNLNFFYFEIPLIFSFYIPNLNKNWFQIHFGPSLNISLSSDSDVYQDLDSPKSDENMGSYYDIMNYYEENPPGSIIGNTSLGLNFGMGIKISDMEFRLRYQLSTIRNLKRNQTRYAIGRACKTFYLIIGTDL